MSAGPLPALAPGAIPAEVRREGAAAVRGYRTALGFERLLLNQMLSAALPRSAGGEAEGEGAEGSEGAADPRLSMLPETVATAIAAAGGVGLAKDLYTSFEAAR